MLKTKNGCRITHGNTFFWTRFMLPIHSELGIRWRRERTVGGGDMRIGRVLSHLLSKKRECSGMSNSLSSCDGGDTWFECVRERP